MSDNTYSTVNGESSRGGLDGCSLPLNGLPASACQVDDSPTGDEDIVYRAFLCSGQGSALLRTAATVASLKERSTVDTSPKRVVEDSSSATRSETPPPVTIRYVDTERPLSCTHVTISKPDNEILTAVDDFLRVTGISCEKRHPHSNIFRCHTVVDCCVVRFDIRMVPVALDNGVSVEFKRTSGAAEPFSKIFKQFQLRTDTQQRGRPDSPPVSPCARGLEDDEPVDELEIKKAVTAITQWIKNDATEALQCVGQFYIARNVYVVQSQEIIDAVCSAVETLQNSSDEVSVLTTAVAMSCVRQFMSSSDKLKSSNALTAAHVSKLVPGVTRAAMGADATARREAVGLLLDLNPSFGADIKRRVSEIQGLSLDAIVLTRDIHNCALSEQAGTA